MSADPISFEPGTLAQEAFWRALIPHAPLNAQPFRPVAKPYPQLAADEREQAQASLQRDGYLVLPPRVETAECAQLAALIQSVTAAGLPALFALVYDPIWQMLQRLAPLFEPFLGPEPRIVPDFWCWQLDGKHESSGWSWHRDKVDEQGFFDERGRPLVLTVWIPFTDVTLENGCIEVLPASMDPNFPDNVDYMDVAPELEHAVRKLPVKAGSAIAWHLHQLHRGTAYTERAQNPRISMGIYLQSARGTTFKGRTICIGDEVPLLDRLGMIARMLFQYNYRYQFDRRLLDGMKPWYHLYDLVSKRRTNR